MAATLTLCDRSRRDRRTGRRCERRSHPDRPRQPHRAEYDVPITDGTIKAADLGQIRVDESEPGLAVYDPGFVNTASCRSAVTFIDGDKGILEYRGYPIEQLAEKSTFLEVAYLLIHGDAADQGPSTTRGCTRSPTTRSCTRTSRSSCRASATTPTRWAC